MKITGWKHWALVIALVVPLGWLPVHVAYVVHAQDAGGPATTAPADPAPTAAPVAEAPAAPAPATTTDSTTAPADSGKEAGFFANNVELIVSVIGMIFTALLALGVFGKYTEKLEKIKESKTWDIAKTAALDTYHTYVQELKKGSADGRLTASEAKQARDKTIAKMKELAKSEGVKLVKSQLPALSELAVNFLKKKATEAKARS